MRISYGYRQEDIARLAELNGLCFEGLQRPPYPDFRHMLSISEVWLAKTDMAHIDQGGAVVPSGKILGFIIVNRETGAYLWSIGVDPGYQRQGIAGNLMREAHLWLKAKGEKEIRLHVHTDNPAQTLYYDYGYRVYSLAPKYYGDDDKSTALMMKKVL